MQTRVFLVKLFFIFSFLLIILRLFYWQVYKGEEFSRKARAQYQKTSETFAHRGEILSTDGSWLVATTDAWLVFADLPRIEKDPRKIAEELAPLFVEDPNEREDVLKEVERIFNLLTKKDVVWVVLKSRIDAETKSKIENLNIKGIGFQREEKRFYPEGSSSAHLLGFVGKNSQGEDTGYFGLEGFYNLILSGKSGFTRREEDVGGIPILVSRESESEAISGVDLQTHIDKRIQLILERELLEGLKKYASNEGLAVVMDPKSGAVLGMASYPSYDPAKYWKFSDSLFSNPVISSSFEPGSIFKIIVMASALDAKVVEPETVCNICAGPVKIGKYSIETWNNVYRPNSNMIEVIVNSDNVGMVFVAQKLGIEKLYDYLSKFGFGQKTGIDLQGEDTPRLRDKVQWSEVDLATASFGQGIAVTPIQMLVAAATIANDGIMVKPQVVDKIVGENWVEDIKPEVRGRVISKEAADEVSYMMYEAAKRGESKWTNIPGFKVAGKTGTAQIPIEGHYDEEKTIASFVGFAPFDDPKFVMLVSLKEPKSSPWASETAAPLWYSIAKELFDIFKIQPEK